LDGLEALVPTKVIIAKEEIMLVMVVILKSSKFLIGNFMVVMVSTMVKIMELVEEA
jgi:hypothetical protein